LEIYERFSSFFSCEFTQNTSKNEEKEKIFHFFFAHTGHIQSVPHSKKKRKAMRRKNKRRKKFERETKL
jgi:hypothetical protein